MEFNTTQDIVQDIADGKLVILLDDEDRENEGDLVCAAELVDAQKINFMISKAKGLVCMPLSPTKCDQLNLPMMTNNNRAKHGTGFTVSIEATEGISTGISATQPWYLRLYILMVVMFTKFSVPVSTIVDMLCYLINYFKKSIYLYLSKGEYKLNRTF